MNKLLIFGMIMLVTLSGIVLAQDPGVPHKFYGSVTTNGDVASDNLILEAQIDGQTVASTITKGGMYGMGDAMFYVPDENAKRSGSTVVFYIIDKSGDYQKGPSVVFFNGHSTKIDISVEGDFGSTNTGGTTGGSGGGSSSSGGSFSTTTNVVVNDTETNEIIEDESVISCEAKWVCSNWQDCIAGNQKRICVDSNECGFDEGKPIEKQTCELVIPDEKEPFQKESFFSRFFSGDIFSNKITGAVVGGGATSWVALIGVLLVIAGIFGYVRSRKNK